jgi:hypothetical protein
VGIVTEADTADVADAVLATLDDEPMQVAARPAERDLQHRVQTGDRGVGPDEQSPPDQRTDAAHHPPQLVHAR